MMMSMAETLHALLAKLTDLLAPSPVFLKTKHPEVWTYFAGIASGGTRRGER